MKKTFVLLTAFSICLSAYARPHPDKVSICYQFDEEQLTKRSVCIISNGYGAGGSYTSLQIDDKDYLIETNTITDESFYQDQHVTFYLRDAGFYHKVEDDSEADDPLLYCFKSKSFDMCHN